MERVVLLSALRAGTLPPEFVAKFPYHSNLVLRLTGCLVRFIANSRDSKRRTSGACSIWMR